MHRRVGFLLFTAGWGANHFSTLLVVYRRDLGCRRQRWGSCSAYAGVGAGPDPRRVGLQITGVGEPWSLPASALALAGTARAGLRDAWFRRCCWSAGWCTGLGMGAVMSPGSVWLQSCRRPGRDRGAPRWRCPRGSGWGRVVSGAIAELAPAPMLLPYVIHGVVMAGRAGGHTLGCPRRRCARAAAPGSGPGRQRPG